MLDFYKQLAAELFDKPYHAITAIEWQFAREYFHVRLYGVIPITNNNLDCVVELIK